MATAALSYKLCPRCFQAVPHSSNEVYCPNDGERLFSGCPRCAARLLSPYARFCVKCGLALAHGAPDQR
jgi:predicted amidophosphoribosyltransferase